MGQELGHSEQEVVGVDPRMTSPIIELDSVSKRYGLETAVSDVSLRIKQGEIFTLLGPSGSGKSTTLSIIAGFVKPNEGKLLIEGKDVTSVSPRQRDLGMVFQNYALFPHLNIYENVAFPLRVRKTPQAELDARVKTVLSAVRLPGFEQRFPLQLSGGQQQRVALARAIAARPKIVLMDEPLGALDANLRYEMQTEIRALQGSLGITIVLVTHDQQEAMNLSDRIAIMRDGRVVQLGAPREVYARPVNAFAARFLGEANLLTGARSENSIRIGNEVIRAASPSGREAKYAFVRPEKIQLSRGPSTDEKAWNSLRGNVSAFAFLGNVVRYGISLPDGQSLTADVMNDGTPYRAAGEPVVVRWKVGDTIFLEG